MQIFLSLLQVPCRTSLLSTQSVSPAQFSCPCWFTPIMSGLQASIAWSHGMFISHSTCSLLLQCSCYNYQNPHHPFSTFTFFTLATRSSIFFIATYSRLFNSYRGQTVFTKILLSVVHHASVIVFASKRVNIKTSAVFSKIDLCT